MSEQMNSTSDEISLKELFQKLEKWWAFLLTQWWKIALVGFIGGCIGFVYAWMQPINYTAKMTFVVEEGKSGGSSLGGLASLAGQFGVDVGGSGDGLFSGDNMLLYFKSSSLAKEVLLSKFDSISTKTIADVYAEVYDLKESWNKNPKIGDFFFQTFPKDKSCLRIQDSLIQKITESILSSKFSVGKVDKKAGFIEVITKMKNEHLAKVFCERVVKIAVDRYITIKIQRQKRTVDKLQTRVDSLATLLNQKTKAGANLQAKANTMDINPLYNANTTVVTETTIREKTMLATIFASAAQNLELAKFTLSQETPVIQVIDAPIFPLKKEKISSISNSLFTAVICILFFTFVISVLRFVKNQSKE